ncbi:MAG: hypothetical protein MJ091_01330 [Clostridia bacterium]|nr:hypothetical protein [Clostridia bacterium]
MKRSIKIFFKSFYFSMTLVICLIIAVIGAAKVYENARLIGFGEYKKAVEISNGHIRILDFEFDIDFIKKAD